MNEHDRKSTATEAPRIVGLVNKHPRPKSGLIAIVPESAARLVNVNEPAPARCEPAPDELSIRVRIEPRGARVVSVRALGKTAIVALLVAVVVRVLAGGGVVELVRELRRPDPGRCTEHIERTTHTEYIERTCAHDGS